jgi:hypothetical protein
MDANVSSAVAGIESEMPHVFKWAFTLGIRPALKFCVRVIAVARLVAYAHA